MQIVAPAGSFSGLVASIKGGADAVYLGLPMFGARAKAENFSPETLVSAVEYAHLFGVKVFVTLNTLIKDGEMESALNLARYAYDAGADAAIVQDVRFIRRLRNILPDFALHASTQMGIHNAEGARQLLDFGITRGVLARETLPNDIVEIKNTGLEIEYFVQGALCICFSGNCYFSSLASSYSGNRGKCMQLCRKPYSFEGKNGYFLSAKDLCLYDKLEYLKSLGVDAIKIEGRMRSDEYAFRSTAVYKGEKQFDDPINALKSVFNRGDYCSSYIESNAPHNVVYAKSQGNIGVPVGNISSVNGNNITIPKFIPHARDGFKIMRVGREVCGAAEINGSIIADGKCLIGDEVRRTFDGAVTNELKDCKRLINVDISVDAKQDMPLVAWSRVNGLEFKTTGGFVLQPAKSSGLSRDEIVRSFQKVADYPFSPKVKVNVCGEVFAPKSAINDFRRSVYADIKQAILNNYQIKRSASEKFNLEYIRFTGSGVILMVDNLDKLDDDILRSVDYIALSPNDYKSFSVYDVGKPILLNMPITMRDGDRDVLVEAIKNPNVFGVISNNYYTLKLTDKPVLLGTGHNLIGKFDYPHITSFEADELGDGFVYMFGYAPVMTLCHCPHRKCINCSGRSELSDEQGRRFTLRRIKISHCYNQLLNCVPIVLENKGYKNMFFDCTECDKNEIKRILNFEYTGKFTRGNFNKGLK